MDESSTNLKMNKVKFNCNVNIKMEQDGIKYLLPLMQTPFLNALVQPFPKSKILLPKGLEI